MSPRPPAPRLPSPRRRTATVLAALVTVGALVAAGCSSSGPPPRTRAEDAAATVAGAFQLDGAQQQCLQDGFEQDDTAVGLVGGTGEPTAAEQEALASVIERCVTTDQFAAAVAAAIGAALPPPDSGEASSQVACLTEQVRALDDTDRRSLMVGLVVLGAPPMGPMATARNDVVNALYQACGVTVGA